MWLGSSLSYLCSAAATHSLPAVFGRRLPSVLPRALAGIRRCSSTSSRRFSAAAIRGRPCRIGFYSAAAIAAGDSRRKLFIASCAAGDGGSAMVPDDAFALLRTVYDAKPTPQVCLTTTGSGGQALSWVLGVPGASSCLLEATVPYSTKAADERMAAGPPAPGYCSREAAEGLARDAYARAVALCVASSPERGPRVLPERRVIGVGCTAAVVSSQPRRGLHHCFVCVQTADGIAHYELNLAKGRRDRTGEDAAVSRLIIQAMAEAAEVPVSRVFKAGHLFPNIASPLKDEPDEGGSAEGSGEQEGTGVVQDGARPPAAVAAAPTEVVPTAEIAPEPGAFEQIVAGRYDAVLVVPKDTRGAPGGAHAEGAAAAAAADSASSERNGEGGRGGDKMATAVVLRDGTLVRAALPRGATVVLSGSYNPLHKGHVGLLEAARELLSARIKEDFESRREGEVSGAEASSVSPTRTRTRAGGAAAASGAHAAAAVRGHEEWAVGGEHGDGSGVVGGGGRGTTAVHGIFEVSLANADKGGLDVDEVRRRVEQFSEPGSVGWPYPVAVTRAPLFSQKARLFPGCAFVVGADTAKRIIDPKYYGNNQAEMVSALAEIRYLGCSFIVGGRQDAEGRFLTLDRVLENSGLPESLLGMFLGLDESAFREDLSSTSIRAGKAKSGL